MNHDEIIAVFQGNKVKKEIQLKYKNDFITINNPTTDGIARLISNGQTLRVKPEPKQCWVAYSSNGFIIHAAHQSDGKIAHYDYTLMTEAL